jgi:3-isopropylmalate/(R)-2-methylmalate dehydratase large subunit
MTAPPMTGIEKILARAAGAGVVRPDETHVCRVDMTVVIDLQFKANRWLQPVRLRDPERVAIVLDHAVPAPSIVDANAGVRAREFAGRFGITGFHDVGAHGIVHQVIAEQGLARPGQVLSCTDSHTCAAGALNCAGRGLGTAEIIQILCTGTTWFRVPRTVRYELTGRLPELVSGKDLFLHLAGEHGDASDQCLEFGGPGVAALSMADRRTVAAQTAEVGADFALFPADELCLDFLARSGVTDPEPVAADPDAEYVAVRAVDLSALQPMVALPDGVIDNTVPVGAADDVRIDQCFIGSCANGQLDDLRVAADVLRGRRVAAGVRLLITPASQRVYLEASRLGYLTDLVEAGAVVTNSTCGACFGYHMGVVGDGEVCLTASTRNFKGRMGSPRARIYMASPATVAASAVTGVVTDPRELTC